MKVTDERILAGILTFMVVGAMVLIIWGCFH